jgi:hypothetical protein
MLSVGLGIHAPVKTASGDSTASSMLPLTPHAAYRRNSRLVLQAQPVDATPSNQLIPQYFPWRTNLFGRIRSNPSQGSVPADLT